MILIDKILSKILTKDEKAEYINLIVDNIHSGELFYIKENIILKEYNHLKTPESIFSFLKELKSNNMSIDVNNLNRNIGFVKDSLRYSNKKGESCDPKPLFEYWVTFEMLDVLQLKWYFYFRERALNGEYLDTDFSYIMLFAYELINYTLNDSAAFNISMVIRLYENYKERQPKLANYLPAWIFDSLFELGEKELANKWGSTELIYKEPIFDMINEKKDELGAIPFTFWRNYIQRSTQTELLMENRNKIYNVFKQGISLLSDTYKTENINLIKKWFTVTETKHNRNLFASAVMGRQVSQIEITIKAFEPNNYLYLEITALFQLSKDVVLGFANEIKEEEKVLPENFKNLLIDKAQSQKYNKVKDRFKLVQQTISINVYVDLPKPQEKKKDVKVIEFDRSKIEALSKQSEELQKTFRDKGYEDEEMEDNTPKETGNGEVATSLESLDLNGRIFDIVNGVSKGDIEDFTKALTSLEKKYLLSFDNLKRTVVESKTYFKQNGMMAGTFISRINEKANEHLEDNIIEIDEDYYEINEEFEEIISNMKEGDKIEH